MLLLCRSVSVALRGLSHSVPGSKPICLDDVDDRCAFAQDDCVVAAGTSSAALV